MIRSVAFGDGSASRAAAGRRGGLRSRVDAVATAQPHDLLDLYITYSVVCGVSCRAAGLAPAPPRSARSARLPGARLERVARSGSPRGSTAGAGGMRHVTQSSFTVSVSGAASQSAGL